MKLSNVSLFTEYNDRYQMYVYQLVGIPYNLISRTAGSISIWDYVLRTF